LSVTGEFINYLLDVLEPLGVIRHRRLFGGAGLYYDGKQFAILMDNRLYLVTDDTTRSSFERHGMLPFSNQTKRGRVLLKRYYEVPEDVMADPALLPVWARHAVNVASAGAPAGRKRGKFVAGFGVT